MVRGRGGSLTPLRVVELLNGVIAEKGQSTVEKETGLSHSMISRYKRGIGEPSTATLEKLADYFDVPALWLRGDFTASYETMKTIRKVPDNPDLEKKIDEIIHDLNLSKEEAIRNFTTVTNITTLTYEIIQVLDKVPLSGLHFVAKSILKFCTEKLNKAAQAEKQPGSS